MSEQHAESPEQERDIRALHRDERRRSLILAAYQLIAEKGFEQLRTRDVAALASVNIATLHYYFATKEDLIQAVVEYLLSEFRTAFPSDAPVDDTTPLRRVRAMFLMTHKRFQARPEMFIVLSELTLRSLRDSSIHPALQYLDAEWRAYLQYLITDGVRQRAFRVELDPEQTAIRLIMLFKGFFFHSITSPEDANIDQLLKDIERILLS